MQLRLKSQSDVRLFTLAITLIALVGNLAMEFLFLPPEFARQIIVPEILISVILAAPISYFVGVKMLDVHKLTESLEHVADHDVLTGAATRLSFYKHLQNIDKGPFALIVADIDHFKSINDRYGHQIGDAALRHFTETLVRNCREEDVVARFGGEEFLLLLCNADLKDGICAADRLCRRISEKPLETAHGQLRLTASFGVAELKDVACVEDAISRADKALYRAKEDGRNRVCAFDPVLDLAPPRQTAAE